jgi:hypothetical protein
MTNKYLTVEVDAAPQIVLSLDERGMLTLACEEDTPIELVRYLFSHVSDNLGTAWVDSPAKTLQRVADVITAELQELVSQGHVYRHPFIREWGFDKEVVDPDPKNVYVADFKFTKDRTNIQ